MSASACPMVLPRARPTLQLKRLGLAALIALSLPTEVHAQETSAVSPATTMDPHWYAGLRGGQGWSAGDSDGLETELAAAGTPAVAGIDRRSAVWSVYGGYVFDRIGALEAGYVDLGRYDTTVVAAPGTDIAELTRNVGELRPAAGAAGYLALRVGGPLPWYRPLRLHVRIGPVYWRDSRDYELPEGERIESDRDGIGLLAGSALSLQLGRGLSLGVGADLYRLSHGDAVKMLSGQIEYSF